MSEENLMIGKITKKVETELGVSFPGNHKLFVPGAYLDQLARRKPTDYLAILEEAKSMIEHPDFVSFDEVLESLTYYRAYYDHGFVFVGVRFILMGIPRMFVLNAIKKNPSIEGKPVRISRHVPKKG